MSKWLPIRALNPCYGEYVLLLTGNGQVMGKAYSGNFFEPQGQEPLSGVIGWKHVPLKKEPFPKESKWVRVEDRKPEDDQNVLVWRASAGESLDATYHASSDQFRWVGTGGELSGITHWRPLPKGPKE